MAKSFSSSEWQQINDFLDLPNSGEVYGIPQRISNSIVFGSWNIRKFGALTDESGVLKKSPGATEMIARFCRQCDLIAIQEVQENAGALLDLLERLNAGSETYELIMSDVTGLAPGYNGMAERCAFLYNSKHISLGRVASDLSLDRKAVLTNIKNAYAKAIAAELPKEDDPNLAEKLMKWFIDMPRKTDIRFKTFVQFIRSPHLVEFVVSGPEGKYEIHCINAHLVSGKSKTERSNEFFALLEWLLLQSPKTVSRDGKVVMILADLNLDFKSNVDNRRRGIEEYITNLNREKDLDAKLNFPFLDGGFFTNARGTETFDHIAYIANDIRWPRARFNSRAGTFGDNQFDYGMFNFTKAFVDAGPGKLSDGSPDFSKFSHDFTDHMPIWLRMPLPSAGQQTFEV